MMSLDWGTPGAGKTHNLMKYQVLPALASGRTVFTNINGLNEPSCRQAIAEYTNRTPAEIDQLLTVFPVDGRVYIGDPKLGISKSIGDNLYELVRLGDEKNQGDLIVLDEASDPELFDSEKRKVNDEMWIFFKKHRHYNVDICLMAHHPRDLIPKIARLCAEYTYYRKLIGFNTKKFRYEKWLAGYSRSSNGTKVKEGAEYYDDKVFACYKSTVAGDASKDGNMDNRFSLWKSKAPYAIAFALFLIFGGGYMFQKSFFSQDSVLTESLPANKATKTNPNPSLSSQTATVSIPQPPKPKKRSFIEKMLSDYDIVYEGYVTHKSRLLGYLSFWKGDDLKVRLTFDDLRNLGVKISRPSYSSHIMQVKFKGDSYVAIARAPKGYKQPSIQKSLTVGTQNAFGE